MIHKLVASFGARYRAKTSFVSSRRFHIKKQHVKFKIVNRSTLPISDSTIGQSNVELNDVELCLSGENLEFNTTWLRDSCHCSQCTHQSSRQRLFTAKDFRRDMFAISNINLTKSDRKTDCLSIRWADGHESSYSLEWLRHVHNLYQKSYLHIPSNPREIRFPEDDFYASLPQNKCKPRFWTVAQIKDKLESIQYQELVDGFEFDNNDTTYINANEISNITMRRLGAMRRLTDQLVTHGLARITNVPLERNQVLRVARSLAYERPTGYGTVFNVVVEPSEEKNLAYSSLEFDLHSDLTYKEMSPGIQLLHCIRNSNKGGLSYFSDAFNAANLLKQSDPVLYEVLLQLPMTFIVRDPYRDIKFRRHQPVISVNHQGDISDVYYSPFMLPPVGFKDDIKLFYLAFDKFTRLLQARENKLIEKMSPGDLFVFHNRRVLHGRSSYDATTSRRFLQGCYMDWDEIKCLREKLHTKKLSPIINI